jgi:hypothetical protein
MATDDITSTLPRLLSTVKRPGAFFATGAIDLPVIRAHVDGLGGLGLPIPPAQAKALAQLATPAPYGRGPDTLVDPTVRRCGQIPASAVHLDDSRWRATLDRIVADAAAGLGADGKVEAELYKLLVYEPGGFFLEHRDTEKVGGMFATLIVVLPSEHEGGELVVAHQDRETILDLALRDLGRACWAAVYTDCRHELRPVRSGFRVALVYNLVRRAGRPPHAPDHRQEVDAVAGALRAWGSEPDGLVKVVLPLAHRYTPAELAFRTLKNEDAAVAGVLIAAAERADCIVRLAMVSIAESGSADAVWNGRWSREREAEDFEVIEVHDRVQAADGWLRPDDTSEARGSIIFDDDETAPPGALEDEEPDEEHFREATGNEGGSFERTYRRAALVLWPAARELDVIHQGGPEASIAALERFVADPAWAARAAAMAALVVERWPRPRPESGAWDPLAKLRGPLLAALARVPDPAPLWRFLREVMAAGGFDGSEHVALLGGLARFDDKAALDFLRSFIEANAPSRATAATLVEALPRLRPAASWKLRDAGAAQAEGLTDLANTFDASGDPALASRAAALILGDEGRWPLDDVVVPAVLAICGSAGAPADAFAGPLLEACLRHLRARTADAPTPPGDAKRSTEGLTCACRDCTALRTFVADPQARTWILKAIAVNRKHIESVIRAARTDLDLVTVQKGSPHSLVCTKNQSTYESRARQPRADLDTIARLEHARAG